MLNGDIYIEYHCRSFYERHITVIIHCRPSLSPASNGNDVSLRAKAELSIQILCCYRAVSSSIDSFFLGKLVIMSQSLEQLQMSVVINRSNMFA